MSQPHSNKPNKAIERLCREASEAWRRQLNACGINAAAAFVTPLEQHRLRIKEIHSDVQFIWLRCTPEVCAGRDPRGL